MFWLVFEDLRYGPILQIYFLPDHCGAILKFETPDVAAAIHRDKLLFELRGHRLNVNWTKTRRKFTFYFEIYLTIL